MKKIVPALLVGLSMCMAPTAFADPIQLSGDISVKYEKDTFDGEHDVSGTMSTFRSNIHSFFLEVQNFVEKKLTDIDMV